LMGEGEVKVLYKCIVCGKAWRSKHSLRAHMKIHKGEGYMRTSIHVLKDDWLKFKELCRKHNTTVCHLLKDLIKAVLKGEETGIVKISPPNPVIININQTFLGKPRSMYKTLLSEVIHETELPCVICGATAVALHGKQVLDDWTYVAVCEAHHREAERSFYSDAWIPLDRAEIRMSHMGH